MKEFEALFGIDKEKVKPWCILLPLLPKGVLDDFKVKDFSRGKIYSSGNARDFTLINTGMGPGFTGDAVLRLKETNCRNLILFGSCGLVKEKNGLGVASLVSPKQCNASEGFTDLLREKDLRSEVFYPDQELFTDFLSASQSVSEVNCATLVSLKLEEEILDKLITRGIDIVEMECSAFFSAANSCGLKALALFYVSDIIKTHPFYLDLSPALKTKISACLKNSSQLLCQFIKKNSIV